ncbi:ABC transporter permease [Acidobacteriota bacterium]
MSRNKTRPGRFAVRIFEKMSRYEEDFSLNGDLEEEFGERMKIQSLRKARIWYLLQALKSLPSYLKYRFSRSFVMLKNYVVTALRYIQRQKGFSFLNLFGLSIGITCFFLISIYVMHEMNFDRYHSESDRIYRVCSEHAWAYHGKNKSAITPAPLAPALREDLPDVETSVRLTDSSNILLSKDGQNFLEDSIIFSDPEIFDVFSFTLLKGDPKKALSDPYSIILSERIAQKYYGNEEPIGKILRYRNEHDLKITGILQNVPENSHFIPDLITSFQFYDIINNVDLTQWSLSSYYTYVKLTEKANLSRVEEKLQEYLEKYAPPGLDLNGFGFFLQPLTRIHLHSDLIAEISANNDIKNIYIFGSVALLILIIACINYMNLITARASQRTKEVGIRKVVGARRIQVIKQFFGETLILTALAILLSCFFIYVLMPHFNGFVGKKLSFDPIGNPEIILIFFSLLLFIGLFAGSYPAFLMSSFRPKSILGGISGKNSRGISLRNGLVVFQFAISIILIIITFVVRNQLNFIKNTDVGYTKDHIVTMRIQDPQIRQNLKGIKSELLNNPKIQGVSTSSNLPHRITNLGRARSIQGSEEDYFALYECTVDYDFLDLFGIEIKIGRNFSREFTTDVKNSAIINQKAATILGYSDPIDKEFITPVHGGKQVQNNIIGVMNDFNMLSLHQGISPMRLRLDPEESQRYLSVKIEEADISATLDYIKERFQAISTTFPFEYEFFDDVFFQVYQNEEKLGLMFNAFSMLAVLIGCIGLFGLASFSASQRTKEIGIRKVLGASVSSLIFWLSKEYVKWVIIANIFAWPIAYILMSEWLKNFTYKTSLGFGLFFLAAAAALGLALLTVLYQAIKAASANPVISLRYE